MRNWTVSAIIIVALALGGCAGKAGVQIPGITSPKLTDEQKIEQILADVQKAMQDHRAGKVLSYVSKNYHDQEGRDYAALTAYLDTIFKEYRQIAITRTRPRIVVEGDKAQALETFGTTAKPFSVGASPDLDTHGTVWVYLERAGNTWEIVEWGRLR